MKDEDIPVNDMCPLNPSALKRLSEFCLYCGAGIGKFKRVGEGTCPKCDPAIPRSK